MTLIDEIKDYLKSNQYVKAKALAKHLNKTRREINSLLYSYPYTFQKNEDDQWSLIDLSQSEISNEAFSNKQTYRITDAVLVVKNIDLVDRLKDTLQKTPNLNIITLSLSLNVSRQLVARTLHSYQDFFEKSEDSLWSIKSNLTTDISKNIDSPDTSPTHDASLHIPIFAEQAKPSQQVVIEAKLDRNFLVLAPPGTGKTYTLIERLIYAITKSFRKIDACELLVLSFTRSAVGEIRERIAAAIENGAPNSLRYVQVKTFDSYATWLLSDGGYDISGNTYDERIRLLASELKHIKLRQKTDRIARSRYLFVDEIQDLVGVRADLVFELVKRILASKGSVTLLGDPHQSLNDYQIGTNQTDSAEFLEKVQNLLAGGLERFELKESHRYKTPEMKAITYEAQKILDNNELSASQKFKMLIQLIPEVSQDRLITNFKEGSIDALLCRSNCEVFQWLNWHQKQGNRCTVNVGALGRPWPAWCGQAIMRYQSKVMTLEQLINRLSNNIRDGLAPSEEEIVKFLIKEKILKRNIINLEDLSLQLKYLSPTINSEQTNDGLIVSTVHKAKGLEYKNVVVVWHNKDEEVTDEEVRVLYVAITRAKCSILLLPKNMAPFSSRLKKKKGGHMGYSDAGIKYLQIVGLEDFDLETLFINEMGGVDTCNLENYLHTYHEDNHYSIRPESFNAENDHIYALYLNSSLGLIRLCAVDKKMKSSLDAMSWGNKYGKDGALLDIGKCFDNQTIVHPMKSLTLARHIGPAGIMVFPFIQGFYPISRATGE